MATNPLIRRDGGWLRTLPTKFVAIEAVGGGWDRSILSVEIKIQKQSSMTERGRLMGKLGHRCWDPCRKVLMRFGSFLNEHRWWFRSQHHPCLYLTQPSTCWLSQIRIRRNDSWVDLSWFGYVTEAGSSITYILKLRPPWPNPYTPYSYC